MIRNVLSGLAIASLFAVATPAVAHHAMQAEFDQNNVVVISGVLKKVNWVNPHVNFLLDVTEPDGKVVTWTLVHAGPNQLRAAGLQVHVAGDCRGVGYIDGAMSSAAEVAQVI